MRFIFNMITPFICIAVAILFFRKQEVSVWKALSRCAGFLYFSEYKEVFSNTGIVVILIGYLIAIIYVFELIAF